MNRRYALKLFAGTPIAAALEGVPEVEKIERLRLDAGDTPVVTLDERVFNDAPRNAIPRLKRQIEDAFPGVRVVVLAPGIMLSRIRAGFMSREEIRKREDGQ